ncbi:MAG: iron ABC transporter permease [Acholeplasma sp.]|nr:iron ABC transporter permease [Acholeplasma sp.]
MNKNVEKKYFTLLIISIVLLICVVLLALIIGRFSISIKDVVNFIVGKSDSNSLNHNVILKLRLPRTLMALFVGCALSLSGIVYQETFQNRLVSPDILGVSSGASVGIALGLLVGVPVIFISLMGFVFGILSMISTLLLAKVFYNKTPMILILSGVIVGGFMTSILSIIKSIANADTILPTITYWLLGSFDKTEISDVFIIAPIVVISATIFVVIKWKINLISLGEEEATTKGIDYKKYRLVIICVATLLTASAVAFSGVVGWVGLVIPQIVRIMIGRNTKYTIPLTITFGALFMVIADIISRSFFQAEIPLSAVTGFIGVPIFVLILTFKKTEVNVRD